MSHGVKGRFKTFSLFIVKWKRDPGRPLKRSRCESDDKYLTWSRECIRGYGRRRCVRILNSIRKFVGFVGSSEPIRGFAKGWHSLQISHVHVTKYALSERVIFSWPPFRSAAGPPIWALHLLVQAESS